MNHSGSSLLAFQDSNAISIKGIDFSTLTEEEVKALYFKMLNQGMHGLCFSAYEEGQKPGAQITDQQIRRRMSLIAPYTKWTRTFSCIDGRENIPKIAKEYGIKTMVGAGLGANPEINEREIQGLIQLAQHGMVDIAAVGNEVLLRNELSVQEIIAMIERVKKAAPGIPVSYVDAYFEFTIYPELADACDVLLINCYPFWEGCHIDYSLPYMQNMYFQGVQAAKGKPVFISETGWPSQGSNIKDSHPSAVNFMKYFINTQMWSRASNIDIMYFTSVDESWKVAQEGDVGAYWGIWDKHEQLKFI